MSKKELPSPELLRQLLRYEPDTGKLYWRERTSNRIKIGEEASTVNAYGYVVVGVLNHRLPAHRIAWAIYHNEWPTQEVDHINGDRSDNSIKNLRNVSPVQNKQNTKIYSTNTSGTHGVAYNKQNKNWRVRITVNKQIIEIGSFKNLDDAIVARKKAEAKYGFHPNHGKR
jgi:hypothetical protein